MSAPEKSVKDTVDVGVMTVTGAVEGVGKALAEMAAHALEDRNKLMSEMNQSLGQVLGQKLVFDGKTDGLSDAQLPGLRQSAANCEKEVSSVYGKNAELKTEYTKGVHEKAGITKTLEAIDAQKASAKQETQQVSEPEVRNNTTPTMRR